MERTMSNYEQAAEDYRRVEQAIRYLEANYHQQPSLKETAEHLHMSEYHFQRLFTRWAGISPKRFTQFLTKEYAKGLIARSESVLDVAYQAGLSSPGRLHELFVTTEAITPGEFSRRGKGLEISYGFHPTPFGECLLAITKRGLSNLIFVEGEGRDAALAELRDVWKQADLQYAARRTAALAEQIFTFMAGGEPGPLALHLHGTNFQIKVWEALLSIPPGLVTTYEGIARQIGSPRATRAVGNAVGRNPIPALIPCHRVIRKLGEFGGYRFGTARKKAMLGWEMTQAGEYALQGRIA